MLNLPQGYVSKYDDPNVEVNIDPGSCTEKDFRELVVYLAIMNQKEITSLKGQITELDTEVKCLTTAMTAKDDEISELKVENAKLSENYHTLEGEVKLIKKELSFQGEEIVNLQRYTREWGLRFNNVAEKNDENCIKLVESVLVKVGLPHVKIENAHRIGPKPEDGSPRTIAARCYSRPERKEVLYNRKKLFDIGVPTFESLCKFDSDMKKRFGPVMKRLYDEGKRVYFSKGTLIVNGQRYAGPLPPPLPVRARGTGPRAANRTPVTVEVA